MTDLVKSTKDFVESLNNHQLIKIIVGPEDAESTTFMVQKALLYSASEYFQKTIEDRHLEVGENKNVLHFPDDNEDAWSVLIFWIFHKQLSVDVLCGGPQASVTNNTKKVPLLCRSWMLADKYLMPDFQDLMMLEMIRILAEGYETIHMDTVRQVFVGTSPGSPLRKLVAEELVWGIEEGLTIEEDELSVLDGADNAAQSMFYGYRSFYNLGGVLPKRLRNGEWREYMVGAGPPEHWIFSNLSISNQRHSPGIHREGMWGDF